MWTLNLKQDEARIARGYIFAAGSPLMSPSPLLPRTLLLHHPRGQAGMSLAGLSGVTSL